MVYFKNNEKVVEHGAVFTWVMKGRPDRPGGAANLCFALQLCFVRSRSRCGVILDQAQTDIPDEIEVTVLQPEDMYIYKGRMMWLAGMNGLIVNFEGDPYLLFKVLKEDLLEWVKAKVYFYVLPEQFGGGEIIYSEKQWLE